SPIWPTKINTGRGWAWPLPPLKPAHIPGVTTHPARVALASAFRLSCRSLVVLARSASALKLDCPDVAGYPINVVAVLAALTDLIGRGAERADCATRVDQRAVRFKREVCLTRLTVVLQVRESPAST